MRVAYVTADPGVPVFGRKGCTVHVQEVLRALGARGARVDLFATRLGGDRPADLAGIRVHQLPPMPKGTKSDYAAREVAALAANVQLRAALEEAGPFDLVYERYSLWSHAGMEYAREAGTPGVLEVNAPLAEEQAAHRNLADVETSLHVAVRVFGAASVVVAVSDEVARYVEGFPVARGRVHVVPNGVNPDRFAGAMALRRVRKALGDPFTACFVGTLKPWHGVPLLVDAFERLVEGNDECGMMNAECRRLSPQPKAVSSIHHSSLLVVGDGPERAVLEEKVARKGLGDAVRFTGSVAPDDVPALLASADVGVAPYPAGDRFYFSPLKVYEYMAAGLPVVASRIGQIARVVEDGTTGILYPPGDTDALARALEELRCDMQLRERLGAAAREAVLDRHTWGAVVDRILDLASVPEAAR